MINTSEPLYMQIETLGHELVHANHDYSLWLKQQYADPIAQECGQTVGDLMEDDELGGLEFPGKFWESMRVDSRAGSKNLIQPLMEVGYKVEAEMLAAGDIEILGNGPNGKPILVGIEYKSIEDLAACCRNGRFAQQLRGMHEIFDVSWLLKATNFEARSLMRGLTLFVTGRGISLVFPLDIGRQNWATVLY